jgi:hypothetical protein
VRLNVREGSIRLACALSVMNPVSATTTVKITISLRKLLMSSSPCLLLLETFYKQGSCQ